jgi:hypothetical protein
MAQGFTKGNITLPLPITQGGTGVSTQPSFSVYSNANQTVGAGIGYTKVSFQSESWDTNSNFDSTTNYRFTPTIAGTYLFSGSLYLSTIVATTRYSIAIYKNGTLAKNGCLLQPSGTDTVLNFACILQANGSTDYFSMYIYNGNAGTGCTIYGNDATLTYFQGQWVGP